MKEVMEMMQALVAEQVESTLGSKVSGRRNWVIRVESWGDTRVMVYRGGYGVACDRGFMGCFLREIGAKGIRWYEFTYKKDYLAAVAKLRAAGVKDFWGDLNGLGGE